MQGTHLTAGLHGCTCPAQRMTDVAMLRGEMLAAVAASGLTAVAELFHAFPAHPAAVSDNGAHAAGGITGTVLLAESHVCVHTWPEQGAVTLDVYVCNLSGDNSAKAEVLMQRLLDWFAPTKVERHAVRRGALKPAP